MIYRTEDLVDHVSALGLRTNIAVGAADDADTIKTIHEAWTHGILDATLVEPEVRIRRIAEGLAVDLSRFRILDATADAECVESCVQFVRTGECEVIMKGRVSTADLMGEMALIIIPPTLFSAGGGAPLQNMLLRAQTHMGRPALGGFVIKAGEMLRKSNGLRTDRVISHVGAFTSPGENPALCSNCK